MRPSIKGRKLQRCVAYYIKSSINLFKSLLKESGLDVATCMQCLSEKYEKQFADSRIGSSVRTYKTTLVARKEELNLEDLQDTAIDYN